MYAIIANSRKVFPYNYHQIFVDLVRPQVKVSFMPRRQKFYAGIDKEFKKGENLAKSIQYW